MKKEFVEVSFADLWSAVCKVGYFIATNEVLKQNVDKLKVRIHSSGVDLLRLDPVPPEVETIDGARFPGAARTRKEV